MLTIYFSSNPETDYTYWTEDNPQLTAFFNEQVYCLNEENLSVKENIKNIMTKRIILFIKI